MAIPAHRMLIVEDHEPTRRALLGIFTRIGWQVTAAGSVAEAVAVLDAIPEPCCMILDIDLPDGTGDQVLKVVRTKTYKTRVVVSSGTLDPARLKAINLLEPDIFLPKPITLETVWNGVICRVCQFGEDSPIRVGLP
jgi:CheY-like chemotaxis protein